MKARIAPLLVIAICFVPVGCKTVPKEGGYTPYSERPASSEEHWEKRAEQDRLADRQGAPAKAP